MNVHRFLSTASCKRLFQKTARIADAMNRKKITCAHRKSIFPLLDGMFLEQFYKEFAGKDLLMDDLEVSEAAEEMVKNPSAMDVLVSTDMYGTILAGLAAGMVGGSYLTPVGSLGNDSGLFEPMHGPNPKLIRDGFANPTSAILSAAMALDSMGMSPEGERIRKAVKYTYAGGGVTPDVGGKATTKEFTDFVIKALNNMD